MNNLWVYFGGYYPLENFSLPHQNQRESEQSHLGNLNYIFCGHFDEQKSEHPEGGVR